MDYLGGHLENFIGKSLELGAGECLPALFRVIVALKNKVIEE